MPEPKFKVGDRVTHPDYDLVFTIHSNYFSRQGLPSCRVTYTHSDSAVGIKHFSEDELTLYKEEEMTQKFKIGDRVKINVSSRSMVYTIVSYDPTRKLPYCMQLGRGLYYANEDELILYVEEKLAPKSTEADRCLEIWKEWHLMKIRNAAYLGKFKIEFDMPTSKLEMMEVYFELNGFTVTSEVNNENATLKVSW